MSLVADIENLLTGVSNIYIGSLPATPDNVVGIFNTGGYARSMSGSEVEEPTFQVRVRNTSYATGEALCCSIKDALHGVAGNGKFLMIQQQGDIMDLGVDENARHEWSINFRAYYRR